MTHATYEQLRDVVLRHSQAAATTPGTRLNNGWSGYDAVLRELEELDDQTELRDNLETVFRETGR